MAQIRMQFAPAVIIAIEAADGSFADVSQHTADWALSRSKLL
jgi:hypothetical protein